MKLKVLPLERWMTSKRVEQNKRIQNFDIQGDIDSIYCLGNDSWYIARGIAYKYDAKVFKYKLRLANAKLFTNDEYNALCLLRSRKILNKDMLRELSDFELMKERRTAHRNIRMYMKELNETNI